MKKRFQTIIILIMLGLILCSSASCNNYEVETITLTSNNVLNYINVDFGFGDINVQTKEEKPTVLSSDTKTYYYVTCVCNIYFSPKADYDFTDVQMSMSIKSNDWEIIGEKLSPSGDSALSILNKKVFSLDKNGYGICTVLFSKKTSDISSLHPLQNKDWEYTISNITGTISRPTNNK